MADQSQYAPRPTEGPFSDFLQGPIIRSAPHQSTGQFTGWEGKTGATLGLVDKFIAGIGEGRMMRALADEKQKTQKLQGFVAWGNSFLNNPDLDPTVKQQFQTDFQHALLSEVNGALDSGGKEKGKGHPIVGALKGVISGLAGGEVAKSKYDMKAVEGVINKYYNAATDPNNSITGKINSATKAIQSEFARLKKENRGVDPSPEQLNASPAYQDQWSILRKYAGKDADDIVKPFLSSAPKVGTPEADVYSAQQRIAIDNKNGGQPPASRTEAGAPPGHVPSGREMVLRQPGPPQVQPPALGGQRQASGQFTVTTPEGEQITQQGDPENYSATVTATAEPPKPRPVVLTPAQMDLIAARPSSMDKPEFVKINGKDQMAAFYKGGGGIPAGYYTQDETGAYNTRVNETVEKYEAPKELHFEKGKDGFWHALDPTNPNASAITVRNDKGQPLEFEQPRDPASHILEGKDGVIYRINDKGIAEAVSVGPGGPKLIGPAKGQQARDYRAQYASANLKVEQAYDSDIQKLEKQRRDARLSLDAKRYPTALGATPMPEAEYRKQLKEIDDSIDKLVDPLKETMDKEQRDLWKIYYPGEKYPGGDKPKEDKPDVSKPVKLPSFSSWVK